jgi:hypothetical protein
MDSPVGDPILVEMVYENFETSQLLSEMAKNEMFNFISVDEISFADKKTTILYNTILVL